MFGRFIARFFTAQLCLTILLLGRTETNLCWVHRVHDEPSGTVGVRRHAPLFKCGQVRPLQSQRDILHRSFHNLGVSPLTEPALNASHGDVAGRYAQMRGTTRVHERALFAVPRIPSELELQARWFAGDFGTEFVSTNGDRIDIVQFGVWNREAGPDFRDAAIRINAGEPIHGCIEIDLLDRSWESHGHATNPAFEATALHVFVERSNRAFFTRTLSNRNVPQVCIDPATLRESFNANIPLAHPGRCQAPLKNLPEERVRSVLDAAAQFRLRQKANRMRNKTEAHGRDEALFQEIATALGYKENKLPFTLLTQRLPLRLLRENVESCEALPLAQRVSLRGPTSISTKNPRANMCGNSGTVGGHIAMLCSD
jgi:uncharacterized protein DUF2851